MCVPLVDSGAASEHSQPMSNVSLARRAPIWVRSLMCLPLLVLPLACASEGGQTGDEFGSTAGDTGAIDNSRIKVELVDDEVHVTGRAGAVPDGATLQIKDIDSGEVIEVEADDDGSFDAVVDGDADGTYEVRVKGKSSIPAAVVSGEDAPSPEEEDAGSDDPVPNPTDTGSTPTQPDPTTEPTTDPTTEPTNPNVEPPPDPTTEPPDPTDPPSIDGGAVPEPLSEEEARAQFEAYVAENSSCSDDSECAILSPGCPLGCVAYVNASSEDEAKALAQSLVQQVENQCDYDCEAFGVAACLDGQCGERPEGTPMDPPQLCEATGGTWVDSTCGAYRCGEPTNLDCASGGCDCGPTGIFGSEGCEEAAECSDGLELTLVDEDFAYPTAPYLECAVDDDCTYAINSCSQCCTYSAVSADMAETYAENRAEVCEGYQGGVCDCEAREIDVACFEGACTIVEAQ
jgi:hypothetical protein